MPPLPRALAAPAILHKPKGSDVAWNGHLGPRRFSPQAHGPWEPSGVTCREQEPLTSFVLPWGEALGRKRGGERKKKKKHLCVSLTSIGAHGSHASGHSHLLVPPWPCIPRGAHPAWAALLAGPLTALGHPSCSRSRCHRTPRAHVGQSHEGFEPTWGTRAPARRIVAGRVTLPKPRCLQQSC